MPHFTIQIGPNGALLDAWVGVSQARAAALQTANQTVPPLQQIRALIDTGASATCMDPSVMNALGIAPHGTTLMNSPTTGGTPQPTNVYDVSIAIPGATPPPLWLNTVAVAESLLLQAQGFHALIGRDILAACVIHYNGPLKFITVSY
jgi:predicted aspartyl protease